MPSRSATFLLVARTILPQVDRLYIYFDGYSEVPAAAKGDPRIVPILSRELPNLHGNGKMIGLWLESAPCHFLSIDDDIAYPPNYVERLCKGLARFGGRAVVGYHGSILARPLVRYTKDREVIYFADRLMDHRAVDVLGSGTSMFLSEHMRFDVCAWRHLHMVDLCLAMEAARAGLPLICLKRRSGFLRPFNENQADSTFAGLKRDDTRQTRLARELLACKAMGKRGHDVSKVASEVRWP